MKLPSMNPVKSSNVKAVGYMDNDLYVEFHNGGIFRHRNVPADMHKAIMNTDSVGKFYQARIKGFFQGEQVVLPAPAPVKDDNGNPHPMTAGEPAFVDDVYLLGSDKQPSEFILKDNSVLQLGDVVARAFELSGAKTNLEWNSLPGDVLEGYIQNVVDSLDLVVLADTANDKTPPAEGQADGVQEQAEQPADQNAA